jgi:7,8-dihydroneopterin aldolase/epimerase/oxygenase
MKTGEIHITDMRFRAHHGCMEEEARIGGDYRVDVVIEMDLNEAGTTDRLEATADYCDVYRIAQAAMAVRSKLIEHVAQRMLQALRNAWPEAEAIQVKLTKFAPPVGGDVASVTVVLHG